jgi:hypothetical protein
MYLTAQFRHTNNGEVFRSLHIQILYADSNIAIALCREEMVRDFGSAVRVNVHGEGLFAYMSLVAGTVKQFNQASPDNKRYYEVCHRYGELKRLM